MCVLQLHFTDILTSTYRAAFQDLVHSCTGQSAWYRQRGAMRKYCAALISVIALLAPGNVIGSAVENPPVKETSVQCTSDPWPEKVCTVHNVVLVNDTIHFITSGKLWLPALVTNMHHAARFNTSGSIRQFSPSELRQLLRVGTADLPVQTVANALVLGEVFDKGKFYCNWWHEMAEDAANMHDLMCSHLGLCEYNPQQLSSFLLLLDSPPGVETLPRHHWHEGVKCFSAHPPRYVGPTRQNTTTGGTHVTFINRLLIGRGHKRANLLQYSFSVLPFPKERSVFYREYGSVMAGYRARWRSCMGLPLAGQHYDNPATPRPFTVTFVQRRRTRSFVNMVDAMDDLAKEHGASVRLQHFSPELLSLRDTAHMYYNTSLLIMAHGASMANVLFMPNHSSIVEVVPFSERNKVNESWLGHFVDGLRAAGVHQRAFQYVSSHPKEVVLNLEYLLQQPLWKKLNDEEQRKVLLYNQCPTRVKDIAEQCAARWVFRDIMGLVLSPAHFYPYFKSVVHAAKAWMKGVTEPGPKGLEFRYYNHVRGTT